MSFDFTAKEYATFTSEKPFDYAKHSSIGCGGIAKAAYYPQTAEELSDLIFCLRANEMGYNVLGNLTNVLPPDGAGENVVVCTKRLKGVKPCENGVEVLAGTTSAELLRACKSLGLGGAEFLEGIPCTIGGALFMNAGVSGAYISRLVASVTVLHDGKTVTLNLAECGYSYKKSAFMENDDVILSAKLNLFPSTVDEIEERTGYYKSRRVHLPKGRSMGCTFKNPQGQIAGKLIEGAGLKGFRVGGAIVSDSHANFIINDGGATSAQVRSLIEIIKGAVFAQYRIRLEEEIRYLP